VFSFIGGICSYVMDAGADQLYGGPRGRRGEDHHHHRTAARPVTTDETDDLLEALQGYQDTDR